MKNKLNSNYMYIVFILLAGFLWGFIGFFSIEISNIGYSAIDITYIRNAIATLGLFLIICIKDKKYFYINIKDIWMFLATGVGSIVFFNVMYFLTINTLNLSVAAILLYTGPFFVVLLSSLFFKEKLTKLKILVLIIASIGCSLTVGVANGIGNVSAIGILTGLLSGLGYGLYSIFGKIALRKYSSYTVTFYTFLVASVSLSIFCIDYNFLQGFSNPLVIVFSIGLGIISTLAPFILYTTGLLNVEAGKASIMTFSEPVVATIIGILIFRDVITISGIIGIIMIFMALVLLNIRKS